MSYLYRQYDLDYLSQLFFLADTICAIMYTIQGADAYILSKKGGGIFLAGFITALPFGYLVFCTTSLSFTTLEMECHTEILLACFYTGIVVNIVLWLAKLFTKENPIPFINAFILRAAIALIIISFDVAEYAP